MAKCEKTQKFFTNERNCYLKRKTAINKIVLSVRKTVKVVFAEFKLQVDQKNKVGKLNNALFFFKFKIMFFKCQINQRLLTWKVDRFPSNFLGSQWNMSLVSAGLIFFSDKR